MCHNVHAKEHTYAATLIPRHLLCIFACGGCVARATAMLLGGATATAAAHRQAVT